MVILIDTMIDISSFHFFEFFFIICFCCNWFILSIYKLNR